MWVQAVGEHSFAARIVGQARSFRHPRSPLEEAINRLLYGLVALMVGLGAVLGYSLYHRHASIHTSVSTSVAGAVSLVPEGLIVLVSLTYAVACVRMARRGVLAQQLNAIESLASVQVLCVDKTGTLTESALRVAGVEPAAAVALGELETIAGRYAASASTRNGTLRVLAEAFPRQAEPVERELPFSSKRRVSALRLAGTTYVLGAPERLPLAGLDERARELQGEGRRVLALASSASELPVGGELPGELQALGLVVLAEALRPNVQQTIAFLREQDVEIKVLSGDSPATAASVARDVGIPVANVSAGEDIPEDGEALREFALATSVIGRVSPDDKRRVRFRSSCTRAARRCATCSA